MKSQKYFVLLLMVMLCACKTSKVSTATAPASSPSEVTDISLYFGSEMEDKTARQREGQMKDYVSYFETKSNTKINCELVKWGYEGEHWYVIHLKDLAPEVRAEFISGWNDVQNGRGPNLHPPHPDADEEEE